ncbi:MAG: 50S ribosomal protein L24 [Eubacteriales bacterium]
MENTNKKLSVRRDDTVIVVSGDDKGKKGKVVEVSPKEGKIIVEGVNKVKKHTKPRRQGEVGGIVEAEGAIYACKVQLYCAKCAKGVRTAHKIEDGKKIRVCAKCGAKL